MFQALRPWIFWLAAPLVIILGTFAGIRSAQTEQASVQVAPRPAEPAAILRQLPSVLTGRILRFDLAALAIVVQRLDGRTVSVFVRPATAIRMAGVRVLPRELQVGDIITVVGKPVANQGVNATLISIAPRRPKTSQGLGPPGG